MKRKNVLLLSAGIGIGVVIGLLFAVLLLYLSPWQAKETSASGLVSSAAVKPEGSSFLTNVSAGSYGTVSDVSEAAYGIQGLPDWSAERVYTGGDKVLYRDKIYRAKWWTQGETPGQADVWEDTLETPVKQADSSQTSSLSSDAALSSGTGNPSDKGLQKSAGSFKVVGYYPSWKPGETAKLRYDSLTHINYAFAIPTAEGGLLPLENEDTARQIIHAAHENGVKVLIAVGGWSYQDTPLEPVFVSATENEQKLATFASSIVELCDRLGFDGVDMDWEHPRVDGSSGQQYEALMLLLSEKLQEKGKLLTSAVLSGATADGNVYYDAKAHSDRVLEAVDWINVMAYDGGDGERHSSYPFAVDCGNYWSKTRGVPPSKVVLGVPFYARPSWAGYGEILQTMPGAWNTDCILYNGMSVWYNGVPTIRTKTQYAMENLGGLMIWEVTQDSADNEKSLLAAIGREAKSAKP